MLLCPASRRLTELQNKLSGPRQIVGNLLRCGDSELNAFRILATFSGSFVTHLGFQGQNPFVASFTLQGQAALTWLIDRHIALLEREYYYHL